jgi:hypothetical protein
MSRSPRITKQPDYGQVYAGHRSEKFWLRVRRLSNRRHGEVYSLGVALQNLEHQVLKALYEAEQQDAAHD